ncbi:MAG: ABC transporter permease [Thermoplasmata archaeon]
MAPPNARRPVGPAVAAVLSASLLGLFVLPIVALFVYVGWGGLLWAASQSGFLTSIQFTLLASGIAVGLGLLTGVPLGYVLARYRFPGRALVESIVLIPVMIPHLVVGIALLLMVEPTSPLGHLTMSLGIPIYDAIWGVVLVMLYVGASYVVLASQLAFRAVDPEVVDVARSLGATPGEAFATVTLRQSVRGIVTGALLMWARGVSEIGAFLILAYAIVPSPPWFGPSTNPASVWILNLYDSNQGLYPAAAASCVLVLVALTIFLAVRLIDRTGLYTPRGGWLS